MGDSTTRWGPLASVDVLQRDRYARAGDVSIAYQAFGSGAVDLVLLSTFWNQIEHHWELPSFARALGRLASFARVIMLDKRGSGLSDRVMGTPSARGAWTTSAP